MSPEERLRRLRDDERWADAPFRTDARPAGRGVPWRPVAALGLALAAVLGITVLIGQERPAAPRAAAAVVPWRAIAAPGTSGLHPLGETGADRVSTSPLHASIRSTGTLAPGSTGQYVVRLTNGSATAVRWTTCPAYTETLTSDGAAVASRRYRLNCSGVRGLAAGAHADFAMRVPVPSAAAHPLRLTWRLDGAAPATKEIP